MWDNTCTFIFLLGLTVISHSVSIHLSALLKCEDVSANLATIQHGYI